jgi:hypothetical protein
VRIIARAVAVAVAGLLVAALPATAQTDVGGSVPSYMELRLDEPEGFASFPAGAGEHELSIRTRVTSTTSSARLSAVDGDLVAGSRLGRLASGASVLDEPLEARVGSTAFQPLDATIDPLLVEFGRPVANERATIRLRQRINAGERPRGTYTKTLLITLSSNAP